MIQKRIKVKVENIDKTAITYERMLATVYSQKGKDFEGRKLNENTLNSDVSVIWRNKEYKIGNRRNNLVELWWNNEFIRIVSTSYIRLARK